nr:alanine racemase [Kluyvera intermedia]
MSRPVLASLDLQALRNNLAIVRRAAGSARIWSVVKANAYGHGLDRVWNATERNRWLRDAQSGRGYLTA